MTYAHFNNESEAIYIAIQAYFQQAMQQQDLLALRGKVDIADNWQEFRELEIN